MGLNQETNCRPELAIKRVRNFTQILINTYSILAERSIVDTNERDLEEFANILYQYSSLVNKTLEVEQESRTSTENCMNFLDVSFRIDCFKAIYPD